MILPDAVAGLTSPLTGQSARYIDRLDIFNHPKAANDRCLLYHYFPHYPKPELVPRHERGGIYYCWRHRRTEAYQQSLRKKVTRTSGSKDHPVALTPQQRLRGCHSQWLLISAPKLGNIRLCV